MEDFRHLCKTRDFELLQEVVVMGLDGVRLNSLKGRLILDLFVL